MVCKIDMVPARYSFVTSLGTTTACSACTYAYPSYLILHLLPLFVIRTPINSARLDLVKQYPIASQYTNRQSRYKWMDVAFTVLHEDEHSIDS